MLKCLFREYSIFGREVDMNDPHAIQRDSKGNKMLICRKYSKTVLGLQNQAQIAGRIRSFCPEKIRLKLFLKLQTLTSVQNRLNFSSAPQLIFTNF